jgi:uncharacterized membrane protein
MKIVLYIDVFVKQVIYSSTKSIKSVMYTKSDFTNFISYESFIQINMRWGYRRSKTVKGSPGFPN